MGRRISRPTEEAALARVDREIWQRQRVARREAKNVLLNPTAYDKETLRKALEFFGRRPSASH